MKKGKKKKTVEPIIDASNKDLIFAFVFISIATFLSYISALNGTWAMDDIVINRPIKIDDLSQLIGYRKVSYLTFLINQKIGGFYPVTFRLFNIMIHLLNSLLVFAIAFLTLKKTEYKKYAFSASLLSATVFSLHPININAVSYIVQRMASLATMFVLLALLSYRFTVLSKGVHRKIGGYILSLVFILLGIFSKENAVMAIPLILIYDRFFLSTITDGRRYFYKRVLVFLVVGGTGILIASFYLDFSNTFKEIADAVFNHFKDPLQKKGWMARDVYWSPMAHILTEFRVISRYLLLIVFPLPALLVFDRWGYPLSAGVISPVTTGVAIIFIAGLIVLAFLLRRRFSFLSFGILWYLTAISLESFVAIGSDIYFEHRNYLPVAGLFIGVVTQIIVSSVKRPSKEKAWIAALIIAIVLGGLTFKRNRVFYDSVTLWSDTVKKAPENLRARVALGNAYLQKSDLDSAAKHYEVAIKEGYRFKTAGFFSDAAYSLGMIYLFNSETGKAKAVIDLLEKKIEGSESLQILKAYYLVKTGQAEKAITMFQGLLRTQDDFNRTLILTIMGDAYREMRDIVEAERSYKNALKLDPKFSAAYYGLAQLRLMQRDMKEAEKLLRRALEFDPENVLVLSDLSDIMLLKGDIEKALKLAQKAVLHRPVFARPYLNMGNVLAFLGRDKDAERYYSEARQKGISEPMILFSKARSLILKGDKEEAMSYLRGLLKRDDTPVSLKKIIEKEIEKSGEP